MLDAALEDMALAGEIVLDLLAEQPDPDLMATSTWTVRQVGVHLVAGAGMYSRCLRGNPSPLADMRANTLSAFNMGAFVSLTERDLAAIGQRHRAALAEVEAAARDGDPERIVPFHAGHERSVEWMITAMAMEQLLHGWDIARACGTPWRPPQELTARVSAFFLLMAPFLYRGEKAPLQGGSFWVTPDAGEGWGFDLSSNGLSLRAAAGDAGCHVAGDGFEVMLWTSRRQRWEDTALTASGADAHLASEVMGSFYSA